MLTLESKFSEFMDLCTRFGACSEAMELMVTADKEWGEKGTLNDWMVRYHDDATMPEDWGVWVIQTMNKEVDSGVIDICVSKVTEPKVALQAISYKTLSTENITYLKSLLSEANLQKIVDAIIDPPEAVKLYIDCPYLTAAQEIKLKSVYEGKLPTVEKELATGVITRATAEVAP